MPEAESTKKITQLERRKAGRLSCYGHWPRLRSETKSSLPRHKPTLASDVGFVCPAGHRKAQYDLVPPTVQWDGRAVQPHLNSLPTIRNSLKKQKPCTKV